MAILVLGYQKLGHSMHHRDRGWSLELYLETPGRSRPKNEMYRRISTSGPNQPNVKSYFIYRVVRTHGLDLLSLSESLKALRIRPFLSRFLAHDGYPGGPFLLNLGFFAKKRLRNGWT
jgi:hypothetical protein